MKPTPERVRKAFSYDPETGILRWKIKTRGHARDKIGRGIQIGDVAGSPSRDGGWRVKIDKFEIPAAVAAFVIVTGRWPIGDVDHRDRDRMNNRWYNLREATRSQNIANQRHHSKTTPYKGVSDYSYRNLTKPFRARVRVRGKLICLGFHHTAELAHQAYLKGARKHFGEFATAG